MSRSSCEISLTLQGMSFIDIHDETNHLVVVVVGIVVFLSIPRRLFI